MTEGKFDISDKKPFLVALLFLGALLGFRSWFGVQASTGGYATLGGPVAYSEAGSFSGRRLAMLASEPTVAILGDTSLDAVVVSDDSSRSLFVAVLKDDGHLQKDGVISRSDLIAYITKKGDTLARVAQDFGVSEANVLRANGLKATIKQLPVGRELFITSQDGVVYKARSGDSLESIAQAAGLNAEKLREANISLSFAALDSGTPVFIPGAPVASLPVTAKLAVAVKKPSRADETSLAKGYFIKPTKGLNWGVLHSHNAIDIANSCGVVVVAAAEGVVIADPNLGDGTGSWNDGYGHFLLIEHPNGVRTRYAHLEDVSVSVGQYVNQGDQIATMGNTGNTHGPTGCHLHFEVIGAKNPFAK